MVKFFRSVISWLASIQFTLFSLALMMLLIFFGTLAQDSMGTFAAQRMFFNQFFVWGKVFGVNLPLLPGGLTVGSLWLANLVAAYVFRFRLKRESIGIILSHFGLILLVAGQGLTQILAVESQMPIREGASAQFSESSFDSELVFVNVSDPAFDEVVSIPERSFRRPGTITTPALPFDVRIRRYFKNAQVSMATDNSPEATQGVGTRVAVNELPETFADNERNMSAAYVELIKNGASLGTWLVSMSLGAPQSVVVDGKEYRLALQPRRIYYPFTLTLKDFRHDKYAGTDIPKNFSSAIRLDNPAAQESRDVLISMNNPLRYGGHTFYQASFAEEDTVSILQVVENPAWLTPYVSCILVAIGLAIQFLMHLFGFMNTRRQTA
jgi:hypothetical protein